MFVKFGKYFNKGINKLPRRGYAEISNYLKTLTTSDKEVVFDISNTSKIAFIGLNRPKSKNALGRALVSDFQSAIRTLRENSDTRCVVIGSLVPKIFCAGADLKERKQMSEKDVEDFVKSARSFFQSVAEISVPTICAIDGPALGGGLELALACDLRYASSETVLGLVETRLAIIPGAGGTQRLPRLVGVAKAKELIYTARTVTGEEAMELGIVNDVVKQNLEGNAALMHSFIVAQSIAENGPISVKMAKVAIDTGIGVSSVKEALLVEESCYSKVIPTKDRLEGLLAFQEKRKPKYEGK